MDLFLGSVELLVREIGMGEDKNQNIIGTSPHYFRVNLHQNNPLKLVVLCQLGYLSQIGLLGWTKFDITDTTALTLTQMFGNFGDILSKSAKKRMGP